MPELIAQKWVQNGFCLSYDAKPVFIHGAIPGETVKVNLIREREQHQFAVVEEVLIPSKVRHRSECPIFPECGGCSFRHISYEKEKELKRLLLSEMSFLEECLNITKAPLIVGQTGSYRNHVQIQFDGRAGFFALHSNRLLPLPESGCLLLPEELNRAIFHFHFKEKGKYRFRLADQSLILPDCKDDFFYIKISNSVQNLTWKIPVDGFFQTNRFLIEPWLNTLRSMIPSGNPETTELFCGSGVIGGFVRDIIGKYHGYEMSDALVKKAKSNFKDHHFEGKFSNVDLYKTVPEISDLLILNPPRAGAGRALFSKLHKCSHIVYSSCNPRTMNRDLKEFLKVGFTAVRGAIFDFFPGTPHLEVVISLERTKGNKGI